MRRQAQRIAEIAGAAFTEILIEQRQHIAIDSRKIFKARIGPVIARQRDEERAGAAAGLREAFKSVTPVVEAAEAAHDDDAAAGDDAVDVEVDRHRMLQLLQVAEAQRRQRGAVLFPRGRERGQIAVGKRQHHHLGRRLPKIDGGLDFIEACGFGRKEVHGAAYSPAMDRAIAARSSPFWPMTTRRPCRSSPGTPGTIELLLEACADTLDEQAHRLALDVGKALHAQDVVRARRSERGAP